MKYSRQSIFAYKLNNQNLYTERDFFLKKKMQVKNMRNWIFDQTHHHYKFFVKNKYLIYR